MIPVNVIAGFLGAGKTTAILQLFSQKKTEELWAVVVNEFGKISIDSQILRSNTPNGKVFDITGGCICCTAKTYLSESLKDIIETGLYSRIIIEPSGLGGIDMVSEIVQAIPILHLKPVICLVDITTLEIPRLQFNPVYQKQITKSDIVIFTKTDLISNRIKLNELVQRFSTNFPKARIHNNFSIEIAMLDVEIFHNDWKDSPTAYSLFDPTLSADNYLQKNCIFDAGTIFDSEKLSHFLYEHNSIIRAKGFVNTYKGWKLMNYTLSGCVFEDCDHCFQNEIVFIADKSAQILFEKLELKIQNAK